MIGLSVTYKFKYTLYIKEKMYEVNSCLISLKNKDGYIVSKIH